MYLINLETFKLEEFYDEGIPRYAILSHRWEDGEVDFRRFQRELDPHFRGWQKIKSFCRVVDSMKIPYAWIDTCCIDKSSSAHMSEAINSMWKYYSNAQICFVYLNDVTKDASSEFRNDFVASKWFTRGWTLQELLAPENIRFYDSTWTFLGAKENLLGSIVQATGISDVNIAYPQSASIAARMSWMSRRQTTRGEDLAYCLLGLFDVNMPLLYGEGRRKAFYRLQLEIIRASEDESIFAFTRKPIQDCQTLDGDDFGEITSDSRFERESRTGILAREPADFSLCSNIECQTFSRREPYTMTNKGLRIDVIFSDCVWKEGYRCWPIFLNCNLRGFDQPLSIYLTRFGGDENAAMSSIPDSNIYCRFGDPEQRHMAIPYAKKTVFVKSAIEYRLRARKTEKGAPRPPRPELFISCSLIPLDRSNSFEWPTMDKSLEDLMRDRTFEINAGEEDRNKIFEFLRSFEPNHPLTRQFNAADCYIRSHLSDHTSYRDLSNKKLAEILYTLYYRARMQYTALLLVLALLAVRALSLDCFDHNIDMTAMSVRATAVARILRGSQYMEAEEKTWETPGTRIAGCVMEFSYSICDWLAVLIVRGADDVGMVLSYISKWPCFRTERDEVVICESFPLYPTEAMTTRLPALWGWYLPPFHKSGTASHSEEPGFPRFLALMQEPIQRFFEIERIWAESHSIHVTYDSNYHTVKPTDDVSLYLREIYEKYTGTRED